MNLNEPFFYDHKLTLDKPLSLIHQHNTNARKIPCRPDMHYALHLGILLKGKFVSGIRDHEQTILPGQVWLTAPWEAHTTISTQANSEIILCSILLDKLGHIGPGGLSVSWLTPFVLHPSRRPQLKKTTHRKTVIEFGRKLLSILNEEDKNFTDCKAWMTLHELIIFLISNMPQSDASTNNHTNNFTRIRPVIEYLKKNPHTPMGVYDAADLCKLGKSRFCDLFKQTMGITFGKYSIRARLSGASSEIKTSGSSLKEIANKWGFYDESHFYRQFQQTFNCTPSEFRKR